MSDNWEKHVDKVAEKFHEQAYKAFYQFYGSTHASIAADALAKAYATIVKERDASQAVNKIFTQEFIASKNSKEIEGTK